MYKLKTPPSPTDAITVSCWAKNAANAIKTSRLLRHPSYILEHNLRDKSFTFYIYSGTWYSCTAKLTDVDMTKWHHYTGTFDGNIIRLYVDGVEVNNTVFSGKIDISTNPMYIGSNDKAGYFVYGKIAEAQVWKKALSADQIKANMSQGLTGNEDCLVGYWPLNKGYGDIATDESPNKKHGTIVNAVWDEQFPIDVIPTVAPFSEVKISDLFYKSTDDHKADQYVEITNTGTIAADLSGWTLNSSTKDKKYYFPQGIKLEPGQKIKVYSNKYEAESGGFLFYSERGGVWSNKGDTATLLNAEGKKVDTRDIP
ncbi:LamG-like jellyroll fold domain-containing protein [Crocosphaera sp.]|uniref:LamG-like jellyroll fold domain-containing protein n=1 Tax=Crocosphaera sp. TaxID=2729996 RepID=UPI002615D22E|nr:LamG-like jellyroll fold domain-containing protein [Crocosphaera sp.]MDJ0581155.1 lamin tail domain-containing protein [Crocosphaera sp.]